MPKPDTIHKKYREIPITFTNGDKGVIRSTLDLKDTKADYKPDIDSFSHSAWTGLFNNASKSGRGSKFNDKFGSINFMSTGKKTSSEEDKKN